MTVTALKQLDQKKLLSLKELQQAATTTINSDREQNKPKINTSTSVTN